MKTLITLCKYSLILMGLHIMIASCSPKIPANIVKNNKAVLFPKQTDTARIQFLKSYNKSTDVIPEQSAFKTSIIGEQEVLNIIKPFGASISNGKIYICDLGTNDIVVIDLKNKSFNKIQAKVKGGLAQPINIFTDTDGSIYLANPLKQVISVYDANMNYITEFGEDIFHRPIDMAVTDNKIFVADIQNNRVNIFDKTTKELLSFIPDSVVGNDDWLYMPTAISISGNNIYVSDVGDSSLKVYSLKGEFIQKIGELGDNLGQFIRPKGNAADKEGNVYVLDAATEVAQIFNKEGQLLMHFGGPYKGPGDMYLPVQITIDYNNTEYFKDLVDKRYDLMYLIIVTNQFGPEKVSVYGRIELKK